MEGRKERSMVRSRPSSKRKREEDNKNDDVAKKEAEEDTRKRSAAVLSSYAAALCKRGAPLSFILDGASLHKGRVSKKWKILCAEDDDDSLIRQKKNLEDYRPVIVYEALKSILDSPTNKVGMVGAIYVKIDKGITFEVKPHVRIPRTCDRFCGLMLELLEKSCIRAKDTNEILIRVIDNPISEHLPANSRIVGLSHKSAKKVKIGDYVSAAGDDVNLVFMVGAMERGKINTEGLDDFISVSSISLDTRACIGKIFNAVEYKWKIL